MQEQTEPGLAPIPLESLKTEIDHQLADPDDPAAQDRQLEEQAAAIVERLLQVDHADAPSRLEARQAVETMSRKLQLQVVRKSALFKEPIHKLSHRADDGGPVANALLDLKMQVESLDPVRFDFSPGWFGRTLGHLPFVGTPVKRYFARYESASTVIEGIIASLEQGREQLKRDNVTLQADQAEMRELSHQLMRAVQLGQRIDARLSDRLDTEIPTDDPRHAFLQEELLFPLRQRLQDLQQQLAVNQQGVLTTELIIRNNRELIRGVNRATEVTVQALQVAVTLALALANQKIVLDKIEAVNRTTDAMIASTAARLRQQGAAIHRQAASAQLDLDTLKQAFADIDAAMDDIARFRRQALPEMAQTIAEMDQLTARTEQAIARMEEGRGAAPGLEIEVH